MSLDVYLEDSEATPRGSGIFVREGGQTREISREEWDAKFPGYEPVVAEAEGREWFWANITHNLNSMAEAAGIYKHLWRPEEIGVTHAHQLIKPLSEGLARLQADPAKFRAFNAPNGWGKYENLVAFVANYLAACKANPQCVVRVSR